MRDQILCPLLSHVGLSLVAEEKAEGEAETKIEGVEEEGILTIDDTSEFVRGITLEAKPEPRVIVIPIARATSTARESPEVEAMDEDRPGELETGEISIKEEEEMQAALMALENVYGNEDQDIKKEPEDDFEVSITPRLLVCPVYLVNRSAPLSKKYIPLLAWRAPSAS